MNGFTLDDYKVLLMLLARVKIDGHEAGRFVELVNKIQQQAVMMGANGATPSVALEEVAVNGG